MKLLSNNPLTLILKSKGITTWSQLVEYIKVLPYGRNSNRTDLNLVIIEQKGTCSSKHAFLKAVASENDFPIKLIVGLYKMNQSNTPLIGTVLAEKNLEYIIEAHCYLIIDGKREDYTSSLASFSKIEPALIEEIEIESNQVSNYKVDYHKVILDNWLKQEKINYSLSELWEIRERCIRNIENKKK